jgi:hypothetical protein
MRLFCVVSMVCDGRRNETKQNACFAFCSTKECVAKIRCERVYIYVKICARCLFTKSAHHTGKRENLESHITLIMLFYAFFNMHLTQTAVAQLYIYIEWRTRRQQTVYRKRNKQRNTPERITRYYGHIICALKQTID